MAVCRRGRPLALWVQGWRQYLTFLGSWRAAPFPSPAGSPGLEGWESRSQILSDPLLQAGRPGPTQGDTAAASWRS